MGWYGTSAESQVLRPICAETRFFQGDAVKVVVQKGALNSG